MNHSYYFGISHWSCWCSSTFKGYFTSPTPNPFSHCPAASASSNHQLSQQQYIQSTSLPLLTHRVKVLVHKPFPARSSMLAKGFVINHDSQDGQLQVRLSTVCFSPSGGVWQGPSSRFEAKMLWGYRKIGVHNIVPLPSLPVISFASHQSSSKSVTNFCCVLPVPKSCSSTHHRAPWGPQKISSSFSTCLEEAAEMTPVQNVLEQQPLLPPRSPAQPRSHQGDHHHGGPG